MVGTSASCVPHSAATGPAKRPPRGSSRPAWEMAIVAVHTDPAGALEILGVGRMVRLDGVNEAEIAVIVSDPYHRHGLGSELVRLLLDIARREKIGRLVAIILPQNQSMQDILLRLGFQLRYSTEEQSVIAELSL